jgi:hypothetical protein
LNAVTLGHAWGALFDDEMMAMSTGFCVMVFSTIGQANIIAKET